MSSAVVMNTTRSPCDVPTAKHSGIPAGRRRASRNPPLRYAGAILASASLNKTASGGSPCELAGRLLAESDRTFLSTSGRSLRWCSQNSGHKVSPPPALASAIASMLRTPGPESGTLAPSSSATSKCGNGSSRKDATQASLRNPERSDPQQSRAGTLTTEFPRRTYLTTAPPGRAAPEAPAAPTPAPGEPVDCEWPKPRPRSHRALSRGATVAAPGRPSRADACHAT